MANRLQRLCFRYSTGIKAIFDACIRRDSTALPPPQRSPCESFSVALLCFELTKFSSAGNLLASFKFSKLKKENSRPKNIDMASRDIDDHRNLIS